MGIPHKHADLIKAWADGAEIEFFNETSCIWSAITIPKWDDITQYRIKPLPKETRLFGGVTNFNRINIDCSKHLDEKHGKVANTYSLISTPFSTINYGMHNNLELIFCSETGNLIKANVIKKGF